MDLAIGILIIGSLYWNKDGGRPVWRDERLDFTKQSYCKAPIRYGRKSKRGTYTMVFSELPEQQYGQAVVVACRAPIRSVCELIVEAEWLWAAEEKTATKLRTTRKRGSATKLAVSSEWGCVALLANPTSDVPPELLNGWAEHVSHRYKADPGRLVSSRGLLEIPWPILADSVRTGTIDLLLATSNNPAATLPNPETIAAAWNAHESERQYFLNNRQSGIWTFQDEEIARYLR